MKKALLIFLFASLGLAQIPFRSPRATFLDPNGVPLANGCIFSYQAGTTTQQATYTDQTLGTPNPNPVILDSTGSAVMWLGPNPYKFVAWSSGGTNCATGTQQWSVDQVPGNAVINGTITGATISGGTISGTAISGGTISGTAITSSTLDSTPVGQSTPAAGTFTSVSGALNAVAFSATPVFAAGSYNTFTMTLTGNVSSSTITGGVTGQNITFNICQDGTGGRTFAWAANTVGAPVINPNASQCTIGSAYYNGSNWIFYYDTPAPTVFSEFGSNSTTPTLDPTSYSSFHLTLTGNTTATLNNGTASGQVIAITVCQNVGGGNTLTWFGTNTRGFPTVQSGASQCTGFSAIYTGGIWQALGSAPQVLTTGVGVTTASTNFGTAIGSTTIVSSVAATGAVTIAINPNQSVIGTGCGAGTNTATPTLIWTAPNGTGQSQNLTALSISANGGVDTAQANLVTVDAKINTSISFTMASTLASAGCGTIPQYTVYAKAWQ